MTPKVFLFPWYCRLIGLVLTLLAAGMIGFLAVNATDFSGWPAVLEDPDVLRYAAMLMPGLFLVECSREKEKLQEQQEESKYNYKIYYLIYSIF